MKMPPEFVNVEFEDHLNEIIVLAALLDYEIRSADSEIRIEEIELYNSKKHMWLLIMNKNKKQYAIEIFYSEDLFLSAAWVVNGRSDIKIFNSNSVDIKNKFFNTIKMELN